jgi:hypothetical protein
MDIRNGFRTCYNAALIEVLDGGIHGLHTFFLAGLQDRIELELLALADNIRHGGGVDKDLDARNPP